MTDRMPSGLQLDYHRIITLSGLVVVALSIFVAGMGALGLSSPKAIVRLVSGWQSYRAIWAASILRLVFGIALWQASTASRSPVFFRVLGAPAVVSALGPALIGPVRVRAMLAWWSGQPPAVLRAWSVVAFLLGAYLLWSAGGP